MSLTNDMILFISLVAMDLLIVVCLLGLSYRSIPLKRSMQVVKHTLNKYLRNVSSLNRNLYI